MFTFDVFSVCHSLFQSVTGIAIALSMLSSGTWLFGENCVKYRIFDLFFKIYFTITVFSFKFHLCKLKCLFAS